MNYKPFKIDSTKTHKKSAELIATFLRPVISEDYVNYTSKDVAYMVVTANNLDELLNVFNHLKFEIFFYKYKFSECEPDVAFMLISRYPIENIERKEIFDSIKNIYCATNNHSEATLLDS